MQRATNKLQLPWNPGLVLPDRLGGAKYSHFYREAKNTIFLGVCHILQLHKKIFFLKLYSSNQTYVVSWISACEPQVNPRPGPSLNDFLDSESWFLSGWLPFMTSNLTFSSLLVRIWGRVWHRPQGRVFSECVQGLSPPWFQAFRATNSSSFCQRGWWPCSKWTDRSPWESPHPQSMPSLK